MKNLNKILTTFWLLLLLIGSSPTESFSQGWEQTYQEGVRANQILPLDNGSFLMCGRSSNFLFSVLNVDLDGNLQWQKEYNFDTTSGDAYDLIATTDGNFVVTGYSFGPLGSQAILAKFDVEGDLLWSQTYSDTVALRGLKVIETQDGDLLCVGRKNYDMTTSQTPSDILLIKTDADGSLIFKETYGDENIQEVINSFIELENGDLLLWGRKHFSSSQAYLIKLTADGDLLWTKDFGDPSSSVTDIGVSIIPSLDGNYLGLYQSNQPIRSLGLFKFDAEGNELDNNKLSGAEGGFAVFNDFNTDMIRVDSNIFISGGFYPDIPSPNQGFLLRTNDFLEQVWLEKYSNIKNYSPLGIAAINGGFVICGSSSLSPMNPEVLLIKTDSLGNSITNQLNGKILYDSLENCVLDPNDISLENWIVKAEGLNNTYLGKTNEFGEYDIRTDTGEYFVSLQLPNAYWDACYIDSLVSMPNRFDTLTLDYATQAQYECPILNVDISTPFLRRCYDNTYYVSYCNEGTVLAENASVEVSFDEFLTVNSSSIPWVSEANNTYTFDIGNVEVGDCHNFQINVTLDCDGTELGQTHCVSAHILPDSICLPPNTLWDGSTIIVEGECKEDTIEFRISNIGLNDMSAPLNYIVIEDQVIHFNGSFQLPAGGTDTIKQEATGATYRLEADQTPFHPVGNNPSATVEGCTDGSPISIGFVNNYSEDDASPFYSDECRESIGSFDPNDKRGFPEGIGEDHLIFPETELEYHIRFQNTGTDTAFLVVIRDTLSSFLDLTTIRAGASSHNYDWELLNGNVLKFTFDDIMLPDSNVNEATSHGFVKFKITQQPDNLPGTLITNQAGIYFDFNAPVITNMTTHLIADRPIIYDTLTVVYCDDSVYQNDTMFVVESSFSAYDAVFTHQILVKFPDEIMIDTVLNIGIPFEGILYENDTLLVKNLVNQYGCDSVVMIHLDIISNTKNQLNDFGFAVFPNPFNKEIHAFFNLKEVSHVSFILQNQLGKTVWKTASQQQYSEGKHQLKWDWETLPNGVYFLQIQTNIGDKTVKIIKLE